MIMCNTHHHHALKLAFSSMEFDVSDVSKVLCLFGLMKFIKSVTKHSLHVSLLVKGPSFQFDS